jgi:tRNA A58 N-methylase Trm61
MQELITSMMKFSAAMTLFSMQQVQNAVNAAADTQSALTKFREALDKVTDAVTSQIDENKQETLRSMTKVQNDIVDRTFDAMNVDSLDPREMMHTTSDLMKKTSDAMGDLVKKAASATAASSEPKSAADALGG